MTAPSHTPPGTIIAIAPTGAHAKADVPQLPVSTEEVAGAAADCERVGAAVIDLEPRHDTALPDVVAAVRGRSGLLVRVTAYARSETLETLLDAGADIIACPLEAPEDFVADLREGAGIRGIAVHYEVRDRAGLAALRGLELVDPPHVVLVLGEELPGTVAGLSEVLAELDAGTAFTATGLGTSGLPVLLTALAAGGHVRVGMADTLEYADGVPVRDNTQLAARATGVAKIAQRAPVPPDEARSVLWPKSPS